MREAPWQPNDEVDPPSSEGLVASLIEGANPYLLYRGHKSYEWSLVCTLARRLLDQADAGGPYARGLLESMVVDNGLRQHVESIEAELLRNFMDQVAVFGISDMPPRDDRLAWWEVMQHHGAPTRLLDWTRSPLIALWFACQPTRLDESDGAVWIFDERNSWINHADTIAELPRRDGWGSFTDDRAWQNLLAVRAIQGRRLAPLVVSPRSGAARVAAQQSAMTLIPNVPTPTGFSHHVFKTLATKVRIRAEWKESLLNRCEALGLTRAALFRDLDSIGAALTASLQGKLNVSEPDPPR
jgi:FRG domain